MHCQCKYHETCTLVYLNIRLMSAWKWNAYIMYKCSKWEWRQTTGLSMRPTQKSLELCLHLWDRNRSASGIWSQKPADVSGRCLPASLATLLPARQSDIIQNVQLPFVRIPVLITQTGRWNSSKKKHQPNFWTGSPVGILAFPFKDAVFPCKSRCFFPPSYRGLGKPGMLFEAETSMF